MYVCLCRAVTESDVRSVVAEGVCDPAQVVERCGAGTRCGGCRDALREVLATCGILVEPCPLSGCGPADGEVPDALAELADTESR